MSAPKPGLLDGLAQAMDADWAGVETVDDAVGDE